MSPFDSRCNYALAPRAALPAQAQGNETGAAAAEDNLEGWSAPQRADNTTIVCSPRAS